MSDGRIRPFIHGRASGYIRHHREGTEPCEPCLEARRADTNTRRARAKETIQQTGWKERAVCTIDDAHLFHSRKTAAQAKAIFDPEDPAPHT